MGRRIRRHRKGHVIVDLDEHERRILRDLAEQVGDLNERLGARATVDAAKSLMQSALGLTEAEAFTLLRRQAMDARITLAEAAALVITHAETKP